MRQTVNPGHRNLPCETGAEDNPSAMNSREISYTCSRCGAAAASPESLCAPVQN